MPVDGYHDGNGSEYDYPPMSVAGADSDSAPPTLDTGNGEGDDSDGLGDSLYQPNSEGNSLGDDEMVNNNDSESVILPT